MLNRVKIEIKGAIYNIAGEESEEYVKSLAENMNKAISTVMEADERLSLTSALVLVGLDYVDRLRKSEENADNIRSQLTEYMNDSGKALGELTSLKRENEKLKRRLEGK